jgi:hypothetical protein
VSRFLPIRLEAPPSCSPEHLLDVAGALNATVPYGRLLQLAGLATFPPKGVEQILALLDTRELESISLLEWVHFLNEKHRWDEQNPKRARVTSQAVWRAARILSGLRALLLQQTALYHGGFDTPVSTIAPSLVEHFGTVHDVPDSQLAVRIIEGLKSRKQGLDMAILCLEQSLTPAELAERARLPSFLPGVLAGWSHCVDAFLAVHRSRATSSQSWLTRCVAELSLELQVQAVEKMLLGIKPEDATESFPALVAWVTRWYGPTRSPGRWGRLSSDAKRQLRGWTGAVHYQDFDRVYKMMVRGDFSETLGLNEHNNEYKLRTRVQFWRNYQSQFQRIRILLPPTTYRLLSNDFSAFNTQEIARLANDDSREWDLTEVCIFEFDEWYVAQEFRGSGSGIRLFRKSRKLEKTLFEGELSLMELRVLEVESVHDHVGDWTGRCQKFLDSKGIKPDPKTTRLTVHRPDPGWLKNWDRARLKRERHALEWFRRR